MRLRFIGTNAEQAWLQWLLHEYITHATRPQYNLDTGLYSVYYELNTPVTKPRKPIDTRQNA